MEKIDKDLILESKQELKGTFNSFISNKDEFVNKHKDKIEDFMENEFFHDNLNKKNQKIKEAEVEKQPEINNLTTEDIKKIIQEENKKTNEDSKNYDGPNINHDSSEIKMEDNSGEGEKDKESDEIEMDDDSNEIEME